MGRRKKNEPKSIFGSQRLCFDGLLTLHSQPIRKKMEYKSMHEKAVERREEENTTEGHIGMQIESNTNKLHRINENLLT